MKRAIIYTFSGTGNTLVAAQKVAAELEACGYDKVIIEKITSRPKSVTDPTDFDLCGFAYPIHAFNTPKIVLRYVDRLRLVNKIPAFIFKTSGEPFNLNKASSYVLEKKLRYAGFDVLFETHLLMPYNILFRYEDALAKQMYLHTSAMCRLIARRAAALESEPIEYSLFSILVSNICRIQWFGAYINGPLCHVRNDKCLFCKKCLKACPTHNIRQEGHTIKFSKHCCMCMHCAMICPNDAVRPGLISLIRVNGAYKFDKLIKDETIPSVYIDDMTTGYFRLFLRYYRATHEQLVAYGMLDTYIVSEDWSLIEDVGE